MLVVADTSALVALAACEGLSHLDRIFGEIRVPRAVFRECTIPGKFKADRLASFLRGKVIEVDLSELVIAAAGLGNSELEAMALYKRIHAERDRCRGLIKSLARTRRPCGMSCTVTVIGPR